MDEGTSQQRRGTVAVTVAVADSTTDTLAMDEGTSQQRRGTVAVPTTGAAPWKRRPPPNGTLTHLPLTGGRLLRRHLQLTLGAGEMCSLLPLPSPVDLTMCSPADLTMFSRADLIMSSPVDLTTLEEPAKTQ